MQTQAVSTGERMGRAVSLAERRPRRIAWGLGLFSLGLGLTELIAPRGFARAIGVRDRKTTRAMLRVFGLREIASGIGILSGNRPGGWVWGRVAGDIVDLAFLLLAPRKSSARLF